MTEPDDDLDPLHTARLHGIGRRVRRIRRAKEWSQRYVAEQAEISQAGLVNLEKNGRNVKLRTLFAIADVLGVHPADLLDDRSEDPRG